MSLKHILLGLLVDRPASGYTLHKRFFETVRPSLSQIYRTLASMEQEGLVQCTRVDNGNRPPQKVYVVTATGKAVLDHWLRTAVEPNVGRDIFAAQIWFGARVGKETVIKKIKAQAAKIRRHLRRAEAYARGRIESAAHPSATELDKFFWNLAVDYQVAQTEAWLKWADQAVEKLSNLRLEDARSPNAVASDRKEVNRKNLGQPRIDK